MRVMDTTFAQYARGRGSDAPGVNHLASTAGLIVGQILF